MKQTLLFIAPVDLLDKGSGVTQKVKNQYRLFSNHLRAFLVAFEGKDVVIICGDRYIKRDNNYKKHRLIRLLHMAAFIESEKVDCLYIRYMLAMPQLIFLLHRVRNRIEKVAIEVPDYPYRGKLLKRKEYPQYLIDFFFAPLLKKYIKNVFVCSDDEKVFGINSQRLKNGTDINSYGQRSIRHDSNGGDDINVVSISTMGVATAVDRFVVGMGEYYRNGGKRQITLHLVGNGPNYQDCIFQIKRYGIQDKVKTYGYTPNHETIKVINQCDIGLGAIGFHRVGIKSDSTIKSREYGLRGMPIIAENKIDILDKDYPYVMYCAYDDSPVDMNAVIKFYDNCFAIKSKSEVADEVRNYFVECCDINKTMKPVIDYFLHKWER